MEEGERELVKRGMGEGIPANSAKKREREHSFLSSGRGHERGRHERLKKIKRERA
jgi:hypothetical protein